MAKDQSEDIPWGEGEKDQKVYEELCSVFASKKRHQTDAQTKKLLRQILSKKHPVWGNLWGETDGRERVKAQIETIDALMSMNDQKIPALKVLSAVAVCEKYKDWLFSHRTSWAASKEGEIRLDWKGNCQKPCDPNTEPYNFHCGFCSFAKWIKEQELPQEMKSYCKNVLNFLAHQGDNPFLALQGEDDENEEEEDTEEEDDSEEEEEEENDN